MAIDLSDQLDKRLPAALDLLEQMVRINSHTENPSGIEKTARLTSEAFAPLGFTGESISSTNPNYGSHLLLSRTGNSKDTIGIITHLDTVFPAEEEERNHFSWRQDGNRIYGPGTIDIKGGTVMAHLVLSALQESAPELFNEINWLILANSSEEVLSKDFAEVCVEKLPSNPLAVLVFEPGGKRNGHPAIVTARKGRTTFRITSQGKGAHAGGHHARGANAVVQLADTIRELASITDLARELTVNVGSVQGGTSVNRVPHEATAEVEMRAFDSEVFQEGVDRIMALNGHSTIVSKVGDHPAQSLVKQTSQIPPWQPNDRTGQLFQIWKQAADNLGIPLSSEQRGGVSDGNYLWKQYPTIDGLGPTGDNAHCSEQSEDGSKQQEYVEIDSFVPRALLTTRAIQALINSRQQK